MLCSPREARALKLTRCRPSWPAGNDQQEQAFTLLNVQGLEILPVASISASVHGDVGSIRFDNPNAIAW